MKTKLKKILSVLTSLCVMVMMSVSLGVPVSAEVPTVTGVSALEKKTYKAGDIIYFVVKFTEFVTVEYVPTINLDIGGTTRTASCQYSNPSTELLFRYTVQAGDNDSDGIGVSGFNTLDNATIKNAGGENADLTFPKAPLVGVKVDTNTVPNTPSKPILDPTCDTGISNTDDITASNTLLIFKGTADADAEVKLFDENLMSYFGECNTDGNGYWSFITNSVLAEGSHMISARATTSNVNSLYSTALNIIIDTTKPAIWGVANNTIYTEPKTVTFSDANLLSATLVMNGNNTILNYQSGNTISESGNYSLKVTDKAGNSSVVSFVMNITPASTVPLSVATAAVNPPAPAVTTPPAVEVRSSLSGVPNADMISAQLMSPAPFPVTFSAQPAPTGQALARMLLQQLGYTPIAIYPMELEMRNAVTGAKYQPGAGGVQVTIPVPDALANHRGNLVFVGLAEAQQAQQAGASAPQINALPTTVVFVDGVECVRANFPHFSPYAIVDDVDGKLSTLAAGESVTDNAKPIRQSGMPYAVFAVVLVGGMIVVKQKRVRK